MSRKPKFNLEITRIELNPEQAVLACCFLGNNRIWTTTGRKGTTTIYSYCDPDGSKAGVNQYECIASTGDKTGRVANADSNGS